VKWGRHLGKEKEKRREKKKVELIGWDKTIYQSREKEKDNNYDKYVDIYKCI